MNTHTHTEIYQQKKNNDSYRGEEGEDEWQSKVREGDRCAADAGCCASTPNKPRIGQESVRSPLSMTLLSCPIKQFVSCQPTAMPAIPHYSRQL